jgi:hypothetical protein
MALMSGGLSRRTFLQAAGGAGLAAFVPAARWQAIADAFPGPGAPGRFLSAHRLDNLRAVTSRFLPGPPEDADPGALQARCAEAIDALLGAFTFDPPLIHAGGPFSNRAGSRVDEMAEFVALDPLAELGWRIRLEGSRGMAEREFAGPVTGLQEAYAAGLDHLDQRAVALGFPSFAALPTALQDAVLLDPSDAVTQAFVGHALADTLDAMYGPPEYGGNHGLAGWTPVFWPGDVQPRGYTDAQVSGPDPTGPPLGLTAVQLQFFIAALESALGVPAAGPARFLGAGGTH